MKGSNNKSNHSFIDKIKETDTFKKVANSLNELNKHSESSSTTPNDPQDEVDYHFTNDTASPSSEKSTSSDESLLDSSSSSEAYKSTKNGSDEDSTDKPMDEEDNRNIKDEDTQGAKENEKSSNKGFFYYFDLVFLITKRVIIALFILLIIGGALVAGTGLGYFVSLVSGRDVPEHAEMVQSVHNISSKSTMYYAGGEEITELRADLKRTPIELEDISPQVLNAVIATEDEYFYEHIGIVPKAIIRALFQEFTSSPLSSGGSTLTQQLIKQQILTNEVSFERKANEIMLSMRLEKAMEKEEILESYLNVSPFGRNNRGENIAGVQEAAEGIFGVNASELSLPQAAFVAGLPKSPIAYSPYTQTGEIKENFELGIDRQQEVLYRMFREDYISQAEYNEAIDYDITQDFIQRQRSEEKTLTYLYDKVEEQSREIISRYLYEKEGYTAEEIAADDQLSSKFYKEADREMRMNGYNIHTTVDNGIQVAFDEIIATHGEELGFDRSYTYVDEESGETLESEIYPIQNGSTLIDNKTGRIIAFVGGRDYESSQFNMAMDARNQPGSVIKPLLIYGPALDNGLITPATIIPDTSYSVPNWDPNVGGFVDKEITNYGTTTNRWMTAREALTKSQNLPAIRIHMNNREKIDPLSYLRKAGISQEAALDNEIENASFGLGGFQTGPTVLELTSAFASIANNGKHVEPFLISKIEHLNGEIIFEHEQNEDTVFKPETAFLLQDILRDVNDTGTGRGTEEQLNFSADFIAKTGTTNKYNDIWYVASTPEVTLGSWIGYDTTQLDVEYDYGIHPSTRNRTFWSRLMNAAYENNSTLIGADKSFQPPTGITEESVLIKTGMKPGEVKIPGGATVTIGGDTFTEYFSKEYVPGTTTYDFPIEASDAELKKFWSSYVQRIRDEQEAERRAEEAAQKAQEDAEQDASDEAEQQETGSSESTKSDTSSDSAKSTEPDESNSSSSSTTSEESSTESDDD
ncbi:transglycosylase domain-containing protein [Lacticigenium naphthae]|uniref:transglycosylase domain-containing protein n=1 Tax=Lacticigenium naphthae TaxID=515351 RepID=UPI0004144158|nr:transglycosylase domain-containing protein [Lacticigenium naphthae]